MAGQSAKNKKIDIVMDEFGKGTLRSGKSDKRVTNPKQAIAIALSEAERLAHGGYIGEPVMNQYMNRPMFQTPQMREGGGIMAGVAPVRGYAKGDEVSDDDRSDRLMSALSNLLDMGVDKYQGGTKAVGDIAEKATRVGVDIADTLGDAAYDLSPEDLQTVIDILGEYSEDAGEYFSDVIPATEEDFWRLTTDSAHKKAVEAGEDTEGVPMNLQDFTDIVFDPDNPIDMGILGLAATPTGVTQLAAGAGQTAKMVNRINNLIPGGIKSLYSGKWRPVGGEGNIDDILRTTGVRPGGPMGTVERYGRLAPTYYAPQNIESLSNVLTDDEISQSFLDAMEEAEAEEYANGGIAVLKAKNGLFADIGSGIIPLLGKIFGGAKRTLFGPKKIDELPTTVTTPTTTKIKTNKKKNKDNEENQTETKTDAEVIEDVKVTDGPSGVSAKADAEEIITQGAKSKGLWANVKKGARWTKNATVLGGIGTGIYYWDELGNLMDSKTNEPVTVGEIEKKQDDPEMGEIYGQMLEGSYDEIPAKDTGLYDENVPWGRRTLDRLRGGLGKAWDSLDDPRTRAAIMAAAKPVEGYTPINALVAATEGARQYDLEQAQLDKTSEDAKSDMEVQFELLRPYSNPVKKPDGSMESEQEVDARVMKSLFVQNELAQKLQVLLELRANGVPVAESNIQELTTILNTLGGGLTPSQMINPSP